ncbi:unnamed protein product [marine sediment metagenome]|uniref:Uncharacterized protein n=1 Tax=marine sediment metagenome TaxID=412755 RepID=X1FEW4_9ZZZZ
MELNKMVKGLKQPSSPVTVSFSVAEAAPNAYEQNQINLSLNVLDQEVFVVTGVNLDVLPPDALAGTDTRVRGQLSSTSRDSIGSLSTSNVIAIARDDIRSAGFTDGGVGFSASFGESPAIGMDYLAIIAINDFFVAVEGAGNLGAKAMIGKLYGYRAIADAATFAALTQSELLSA